MIHIVYNRLHVILISMCLRMYVCHIGARVNHLELYKQCFFIPCFSGVNPI